MKMPRYVNYVKAPTKGTDVAGRVYAKGDPIIRMFSGACSGQTYVITPESVAELMKKPPEDFKSAEEMVSIRAKIDETKGKRTLLYASFNSLKNEVAKLNSTIKSKMYYKDGRIIFNNGGNHTGVGPSLKYCNVEISNGKLKKYEYYYPGDYAATVPLSDPECFTKFAKIVVDALK